MSYYADKLDNFVNLATTGHMNLEEFDGTDLEYRYIDTSDPTNIKVAKEYFETELGFLGGMDKEDLQNIWKMTIEDCRCNKILFNAIKVLSDKYGQKIYESDYGTPF
jgi:hypothetical protein